MPKLLSTIEKFPRTIVEYSGVTHEIVIEIYEKNCKPTTYDPCDDYNKFIQSYVYDGTRLVDVPTNTGLPVRTVSSWASDLFPDMMKHLEEFKASQNTKMEQKSKEVNQATLDLYKLASEMNADYYDMKTGRTYLIQDYNRTKSFGLPTPGIYVREWDGTISGYIPEP